jgi:hypothetical protein
MGAFLKHQLILVVVELETLLASQARIMKYGLMDKFLSIELEENICLKVIRQP